MPVPGLLNFRRIRRHTVQPLKAAQEARDFSHERFTAIQSPPVTKRIGAAKGKFTVPDNFDEDNEMIAEMLTGGNI